MSLVALSVVAVNLGVGTALPAAWPHDRVRHLLPPERLDPDLSVAFVGTSVTLRHVDPDVIDSVMAAAGHVTSTVNLGVGAFYFPRPAWLLEQVLESRPSTLEAIVFEASAPRLPVARDRHTARGTYWYDPPTVRFLWEYEMHRADPPPLQTRLTRAGQYVEKTLERLVHVGLGRGLYGMDERDPLTDRRATRGFIPYGDRSMDPDEDLQPLEVLRSRTRASRRGYRAGIDRGNPALNRFYRELVEEVEGIRLTFLVPPRMGEGYGEVRPAVYGSGVDVIDLGDPDLHPDFYAPRFSVGGSHMNARGARRYSIQVAECLARLEQARAGSAHPLVCRGSERELEPAGLPDPAGEDPTAPS